MKRKKKTNEVPDRNDPFGPPAEVVMVRCLHCDEQYSSDRIVWKREHECGLSGGGWCCPTPGCDGAGFGFDILPVDLRDAEEGGGL